ncbi:cysteine proteinase [Ochromonadaceae sp. CCMP2298]|nr:cysteine proteinase [Ochromonadaceae sp. CCMP2298]
MIYQVVALLAIVASASASVFSEDHTHQKYLWEAFKAEHSKSYSTMDEESRRFGIFIENLKVVDLRNQQELKAQGNAVHGITKFADWSQAEFESKMLTSDATMKTSAPRVELSAPITASLVDWSGKLTTPVKDQGYCGSCWAFSATEQIESDAMRTLGTSYILSPEQITQCDSTSQGCNGGWTERAYSYVQKTGGVEQDANYPYTSYQGVTGTCKEDKSKFVIGITGYTTLNGESSMASHVQSTGPLSVCVDASSWNSYTSGIMSSCGQRVDHCVQAVGVDTSAGYWKVRNSWGTSWGESGYIRLKYGANTCDITNDPTYVAAKKV